MSALPQPNFKEIDTSWASPLATQKKSAKARTNSEPKYLNNTTQLSPKKHSSAALQLLKLLQRGSSGVAIVMMSGSIALYLATVRIPQQWTQEYEKLEALQRQERQLVALDESLKYEIAQQAEQSDWELSAIAPESTIFLQKAKVEPVTQTSEPAAELWQSVRIGY